MIATLIALVLAAPATLTIGSKAPPLAVDEWIKGEAIKELQPGTPYVVEFWATWCGPCIASIPHLSAMQKEYPTVKFIGVAASERPSKDGDKNAPLAKLKTFVNEKGDAMNYRVAYDSDREMGKSWMEAAGAQGIPTAFIVGKDGVIQWIGHPMEMDKPLAAVVEGTWNLEKAKQAAEAENKIELSSKEFSKLMRTASTSGDYTAALAKLDELIKASPDNMYLLTKFQILSGPAQKPQEALAIGKQLLDKKLSATEYNQLAWLSATEMPAKARDLDFSLAAAQKAVATSKSEDPAILDTLARVYWERGDKAKALDIQKKAVELGVSNKDIDSATLDEMKESLTLYQGSASVKQ